MTSRLATVSLCFLTGCATIANGPNTTIAVKTVPPDGTVSVNGQTWITPATIAIPRGLGNIELRFKKEGYPEGTVPLTQTMSWITVGNILFGALGLITFAIDAGTNAALTYSPDTVDYNFKTGVAEEFQRADQTPPTTW